MSKSLQAIQRIEAESKGKFIAIYQARNAVNAEQAENFFEVELFNFKRQIEEKSSLQECTDLSVAGTFLEVISNGLTFDKSAKHVYLQPRNVQNGKVWEKRLSYTFAEQALIHLAVSAKSIVSCSTPVIVYEGDEISAPTVNSILTINHSPAIPRQSNNILGGFCFVTLPGGNTEPFWMDYAEMERLARFSAKQNKGKANELYSSGEGNQADVGFFRTKIVKAALKHKRKRKTLADNYVDEEMVIEADEAMLLEEQKDTVTTEVDNDLEIPQSF